MDTKKHQNYQTLIFSRQNINRQIFRCLIYECEDLLCKFTRTELLAPEKIEESNPAQNLRTSVNTLAFKLAKIDNFSDRVRLIQTDINKTVLDRQYDLFFTFLLKTEEIVDLNSIKNWRQKCDRSVCYIAEIWPTNLDLVYRYRHLFQDFDAIFLHNQCCVKQVEEIVGRPCYFLPVGIDAIKFCPYPKLPIRSIDLYSMGRRSPITHQALLELAEKTSFFYVYDTTRTFGVPDHREHRSLLANLIQRSRYFINYKHSVNRGAKLGGAEELSSRLFEGAAGGTIMLGAAPDCDAYREYFDWQDAVIEIPYECTNIAEIIADLEIQAQRLAIARRKNVVNSLLRHDWVYRWEIILDKVGLKPTPAMQDRREKLKNLAEAIAQADL
ncbi:glycosyltransferase [Merismopedia glauca]|uniref:Spore protein YkvP/CgeB glycosyl transferase-like domain-containing protein n=1 Tax=Merismopedia glauca CCAP 1448/3 TaxID=1296344 RepID=A0A2T1BY04_9CYAN|nr:glycosyltransferase [Merismopedia glauca]PSB00900.1 hypothetical protein C7B64_21115 [Merismopedia glauca CCAP 1448/3]